MNNETVFCPDPQLDRALRLRTLAVLAEIRQIFYDTTNAEAFRKYVTRFVDEEAARCELPTGESAPDSVNFVEKKIQDAWTRMVDTLR